MNNKFQYKICDWTMGLFKPHKMGGLGHDQDVQVEFMTLLERDREKIEEGRQEEKLEIARNMIKLGFDIDTIIKATGLTKREIIEKLKN